MIWSKTKRREDLPHNKLILIGADYNKEALVGVEYLFDDDSTFNNIFGDQISEGQYLVTENGIETTVDGQTMVNKVTYFDGNTMLWEAPVGKITFSIKLTKL